MNQADVTRLISKLRIKVNPRHRNMKTPSGPEGRLHKLRKTVTALLKYERIELHYTSADEARGYVERLIGDAIRYGECHKHTMEMANYWLVEKQLVHKLFKVLVPRFQNYALSYTKMYKAPKRYPMSVYPVSVVELRGNPFPPLIPDTSRNKSFIHNILLDEARKSYRKEKDAEIKSKVASSENSRNISDGGDGHNSTQSTREVENKNDISTSAEQVTEDSDKSESAKQATEDSDKSKSAKQVTEDEHLLKSLEIEIDTEDSNADEIDKSFVDNNTTPNVI